MMYHIPDPYLPWHDDSEGVDCEAAMHEAGVPRSSA